MQKFVAMFRSMVKDYLTTVDSIPINEIVLWNSWSYNQIILFLCLEYSR